MPTTPVNKEALNALTDLYYLYGDLVQHSLESRVSPQELDIFYLRGGLREKLEQYYALASLDPIEAGSQTNPLTLEYLLPHKTISQVTEDSWRQILDARGDLKTYNDAQEAYGTATPQEVQEVVRQGKELIASRESRSRSGADVALADIASSVTSYENHILHIDSIQIPIESGTIMDAVSDYMFNQKSRGEQADVDVMLGYFEDDPMAPRVSGRRNIKDACRAVNDLVKERLHITQDLFNTAIDNQIIRNY